MKHGSIKSDFPSNINLDYEVIKKWFEGCKQEGLVWHCSNGNMFKVKHKILQVTCIFVYVVGDKYNSLYFDKIVFYLVTSSSYEHEVAARRQNEYFAQ